MTKHLTALLATLALAAAMLGASAAVAGASVTRPGVHVVCTNSQTGNQIVDLTLPTTHIPVGSYTHGKVSCTVTSATFTRGGAGRTAVHVTCVNTVTGNTIVDRDLRTAGIHPGVYQLGKVTCTITPVV